MLTKQGLRKAAPTSRLWLWPLFFMGIVALYFLFRFGGNWAETDSATFTAFIRDFVANGTLLPDAEPRDVYPNGYAYQAISTFVVSLTGLQVVTLQQWVYPLLATLIVLPAWIVYRELTRSNLGATLATLLLFTQPEFLFVVLRSSHEKFTRILMLVCLFLLCKSISENHRRQKALIYSGLFCFTIYACISSNYILANSFIAALVIVYVVGWILQKLRPHLGVWNNNLAQRLRYLIPACVGLVYIFTFHIYPPARHNLRVAQNTLDLIKALFVNVQSQAADVFVAYDYTSFGWINLSTYFVLSIANWILLSVSFAIWFQHGWNWIRYSGTPKNQMIWTLWLFYTAFAMEEVLAAISDASGALSSNLQLRLFPSFSMIAVALVATKLVEWRPLRARRLVSLGLTIILCSISMLSVLKATNEPLFSNKWNFYHPNEIRALQWGDAHTRNAEIWADFDERLIAAYVTEIGSPNNRFTSSAAPNTRNVLFSEIIRLRSGRLRQSLPMPPDALQVYDNGTAQLFHLRPETPYQP